MNKPSENLRSKKQTNELTSAELRSFLETQEKKQLIDLLMEQAMEDDQFRESLMLSAIKNLFSEVPVADIEAKIRKALDFSRFGNYPDDYGSGYSDEIRPIIASFLTFLEDGHTLEVLSLTEYAIEKVESALDEGYDSEDGELRDTLNDLAKLHLNSCREALFQSLIDHRELADRLFELEVHLDWEAISNVAETYANILGEQGLRHYGQLVQFGWEQLPILAPGEKEPHPGSRSRLTRMMESLARQLGDVNFMVDIKSRDLSNVTQFLAIAKLYREAGQFDQALHWAERGIQSFSLGNRDFTFNQLSILLAEEYHRKGRHAEALALIWKIFQDSPGFAMYKMLKEHVDQGADNSQWLLWREKALEHARKNIYADYWGKSLDHSELVRIFLWEAQTDLALQEAQQGGCSKELWLALARELEVFRPQDAVSIYRHWVEPTLDYKKNDAYEEAVGYLQKMHSLMTILNQKQEFKDYLLEVRLVHKPKRNLIKLLDKEHW